LAGLLIGFGLGMALNSYLLRGVDKHRLRTDKNLHKKYGTLNWFVALGGAFVAYVLAYVMGY
jgi:hypothetical protein